MKLLKLYSSNPKFKTIKFNDGLNIVAGLQKSKENEHTYNGIGKSSSLQLVHLMLGSSFKTKIESDKKFKAFLSGYGDFFLDFSCGSSEYTIRVNFSNGDYYLNDEKIGKDRTFCKYLTKLILPKDNKWISFRQVFNCFTRRYLTGRSYYVDALMQQAQPIDNFHQRIVNLSLLGLDLTLPNSYRETLIKIENIDKAKKSLLEVNTVSDESDLLDLKDKLSNLLFDKENFIIAKNYDELKNEADVLTDEINELRNSIFSNSRSARRKKKILDNSILPSNIDLSKIEVIFDEAKFHFSEMVQRRLEEAENFHLRIYDARKKRLEIDVNSLEKENLELTEKLGEIESHRDLLLKELDSKGALEEYNSIVEHIRGLESQIAELSSNQSALTKLTKDQARLEKKKADIDFKAIEYIEKEKGRIEEIEKKFRSIVKTIYKNLGGSLKITKNEGKAKYLYDINVHIPKDGSQGINEVKIFCYDMLLFILNPNLLGFMAHDSYLFSGIDQRQTRTMFKIILDKCNNSGLQYFVNINKNIYDDLVLPFSDDILTDEERQQIIDGTVLKLFDDNKDSTLFGEYFD
ncbi:Uncharacterized protein conserved in bacteria (DUF2326) [Providencia alcalifaciens]|uniref:DUF2326 domain-containing protein n=1 Tax=Providencia alcalifaciens DSM 30120 TaxID=520999 RepID=B6XL25_9GAMM|nr:DUF2326 domain-containing protein [Providencia alcalifaciens]EEB43921.1 hypothetical protein PROVALCAL_04087 [Providencia alcalifaciens DSM 30120]SQI34941.1 Uncharacterized protein conserved in bacteria (DUF2326) [Providencia alcalifaciens]